MNFRRADTNHWNYVAAIKATEVRATSPIIILWLIRHWQAIYKVSPDLTREGGSIPVTLTFAEALGTLKKSL